MAKPQTKTRSVGRGSALYIPVAVLLVLFACIFGISVFLRVSTVEVCGATRYSIEDVTRNAGIKKGDNLLFIDLKATVEALLSEMPYIEKAEIRRRMPDTVVIEITESVPAAVVYAQGRGWIIDSKCRVLESVAGQAEKLIIVDGITPVDPVPGKLLSLGDNPDTQLEFLSITLGALEAAGIMDEVRSVDISNIANISFQYLDRFTVVLGNTEDAGYKLERLGGIVAGLQTDDAGRIVLSVPGRERFESA